MIENVVEFFKNLPAKLCKSCGNEMEEQSVKKTLTIPCWLNKLAEEQNINFSKLLQSALKEYLKIKRVL